MSDYRNTWDSNLSTQAAIIIQMEKLGGIKLDTHKQKVGFTNGESNVQVPRTDSNS